MKTYKLILLLFLTIAIPTQTDAQIWKKITKKAQKKAEDKLLEKVDKKIDKSIDETLEGNPNKPQENTKIPASFSFDKSLSLKITTQKNESLTYQYFLNNDKNMTCIKMDSSSMPNGGEMQGEIYMVFTENTSATFMNMNGMKIKRSVKNSPLNDFDYSDEIEKTSITKTGNIKKILGYLCEEYITKNEDVTANIWATTGDFPIKNAFVPVLGMKNDKQLVNGFVLLMDIYSQKSGKATIEVTQINENDNLQINTSEYKSLGF